MYISLLSLLLACGGEEPEEEVQEAAAEASVQEAAGGAPDDGSAEGAEEKQDPEEAGEEAGQATESNAAKAGKKPAEKKSRPGRMIRVPINGYAKTYYFSQSNSSVYGIVAPDKESFTSVWSIDHVIQAKEWIGSIRWNPMDLSQCIFEFKFPVDSLEVDGRELRESLGLDLSITQSEREEITERGEAIRRKMASPGLLDSENHPLITFTASRCSKSTDGTEVLGNLTLTGVSRQVLVGIDVDSETGLSVRGHFNILHSDFGIDPYFGLEPHLPFRPVVVGDLIRFYFKLSSVEASN